MKIGDLKRNDTNGALAFIRERYAIGTSLTFEESEMVLMFQDDPAELLAAWGKLRDEYPGLKAPPRR